MDLLLPLIKNVGLLALAALLYMATPRREDGVNPLVRSLILGVSLGLASAVVMLIPIEFAPGAIYDTRAGPLLLSGILGGPVTAAVAVIPPTLLRLSIGGIGMVAGIVSMLVAAACSVVAWYILRHTQIKRSLPALLVYATVSTLIALPSVFLVPEDDLAWKLLLSFSPILILCNVIGATILGLLVSIEFRRRAMVTDLKTNETAAQHALAVRERFIAMMSHEVRTPLNAILGYAQLLRDDMLTGKQADRVNRLSEAAKSLLRLIDGILQYSQLQNGTVAVESEPVPLLPIIDEAIAATRADAERKGLELRLSDASVPNVSVVLDPTLLRLILLSLLDNAVKFTERGHIVVAAKLVEAEGGTSVRLTVSDTGIGISEEHIQTIFDPFERLGRSSEPGTGLGMAIVRTAVDALGGTVDVVSAQSAGTTVTIDIPTRVHGPAPNDAGPIPEDATFAPARDDIRILVVDDVPINAEIAGAFVEQVGCTVATASNGAEAVNAVRAGRFDAVLMDLEMPVMDGLEATRTLRAASTPEPARSVPIIALTAYASRSDMQACLDAGMNGYLTKPVDKNALFAALARQNVLKAGAEDAQVAASNGAEVFSEDRFGQLKALIPTATLNKVMVEASDQIETLGAQVGSATVELADKRQALHKLVSIAGNLGLLELSSLSRTHQESLRAGGTLDANDIKAFAGAVDRALAKLADVTAQNPRTA